MASLWIVHRDSGTRAALARLARAGEDSVLGGPSDAQFESVGPPDLVLLGLSGDLEAELEFAHRFVSRLPATGWLLLAPAQDVPEAERLFDALPSRVLRYPARPEEIRRQVRATLAQRRVDSLAERRVRDTLAARFSRTFADLEIPELLRALDPQLAGVNLLVRGEPGTGRSLLARYVHAFGGTTGGAFCAIACGDVRDAAELHAAVEASARDERARTALTLCFEEVDRLPFFLQRELLQWIELGPPAAAQRSARLRFMATACEEDEEGFELERGTEPALAEALSELCIRIPPLRERSTAIPAFVRDTTQAWCRERGLRPRAFAPDALEALAAYAWPGNHRELEAVVVRSLAAGSADPIHAEQLRFEALRFERPLKRPAEVDTGTQTVPPQAEASRPGPEVATEVEVAEPELGATEAEIEGEIEGEPELGATEAEIEAEPEDEEDWEAAIEALPWLEPETEAETELELEMDDEPEPWLEAEPDFEEEPIAAIEAEPELEVEAQPEEEAGAEGTLELAIPAGPEPVVEAELERREEPLPPETAPEPLEEALRRIARAVAHEVRNPLVAIRTFAELLPDRFQDEEFRERFAETVKTDVERLEAVVSRLSHLTTAPGPQRLSVDVAALLDELLEVRREKILRRRLLVLKELDRSRPFAHADPTQLRIALECLLDRALHAVPDRGDAYVASKYHPSGLRGAPAVRVLVRFHGAAPLAGKPPVEGLSIADNSLDLIVAEALVRAQGGTFHLDANDAEEAVAVIDLPAPAARGE